MPTRSPERARPYADRTLAVYLDAFAEGRRVLWIGDPRTGGPEQIAGAARNVLVLDPVGEASGGRRGRVRVGELKPGPLTFREGSFDLAVVPEVAVFGDAMGERLEDLRNAVGPEGVVLAGTAPADGAGRGEAELGYEALFDLVAARFPVVRMVGQAPFAAWAMADFAPVEGVEDVVVDGTLLGEAVESPVRYLAVCGRAPAPVDAYAVVQFPAAELAVPAEAAEPRRAEPEAAEEAEPEAAAPAPEPEPEPETPREPEPRRAAADEAVEADYVRLETALAERGREALELERELGRRGTLVRDLLEQLREGVASAAPSDGGGEGLRRERDAAVERALEAEAARAEAQFRVDELESRLAHADGDGRREAELDGTVRGLRSRVAELEELRELAEGRLAIAEADLAQAAERERTLEQELAELNERFEYELVRARGAPGGGERLAELQASERELAAEVGNLKGELMRCRESHALLEEERDRARAESLRLTAYVSAVETRIEGLRLGYERRIAELWDEATGSHTAPASPSGGVDAELDLLSDQVAMLGGERDGLRARLRDREQALAAQRAGDGATAAQLQPLQAEVERLRAELGAADGGSAEQQARIDELAGQVRARDELVTRLQMELADGETSGRDREDQVDRLREENERLRGALVDASDRVDDSEALDKRIAELEEQLEEHRRRLAEAVTERDDALDALRETRQMLSSIEVPAEQGAERPREITAVGAEAPQEGAAEAPEVAPLQERIRTLEQEARGQETLMRSLTAQVEERDDRIRALERRLEQAESGEGAEAEGGGDTEALQRELLELQERVARLQEQLEHEQEARRAAEAEPGKGAPSTDVAAMRQAVIDARNGLEELLSTPAASSDPSTAERVGSLLRLLSRF